MEPIPPPIAEPQRTRAEEQRHLNSCYMNGQLTLDEWRNKTDELSNLAQWTAEGKVQK